MVTTNPGKYIIGLTGNIGTGKSLVLKMLEQKGAYIIDADVISRRAMLKDAPAFQLVVDAFGKWLLDNEGEIDRVKLGRLVFSDPAALSMLESIIHPFVREAINLLIEGYEGPKEIIAIEAVKLLEGPLKDLCDTIWVVTVPQKIALHRLISKRGMSEEDARQRVDFQGDDSEKIAAATVLINNEGSASDTWNQVSAAYNQIIRERQEAAALAAESPLRRVRPAEMEELRKFINLAGASAEGKAPFIPTDDRAFFFLKQQRKMVAVAGWFAENYIARLTDLFVDPSLDAESERKAILDLIDTVEREASTLSCEVVLLFLPTKFAHADLRSLLVSQGFESKDAANLGLRAWTEAAKEQELEDRLLLVKTLNAERVLKPL